MTIICAVLITVLSSIVVILGVVALSYRTRDAPDKPKGKYSKGVVVLVIALNTVFAAAVLYVSYTGNVVPDALVVAWYSWTGGELLALAGIKITKRKRAGQDSGAGEAIDDER